MSVWNRVRRALIVIEFNTLDQVKAYRSAIKEVGLNVHECRVLAVVDSKKEKDALSEFTSVVYISPQEYSFLGSLKNEDATKLFSSKFDTVIQIDSIPKKVKKSISKIKPLIKVGLNVKDVKEEKDFDVVLTSSSESPEHLLRFVKQILEKLK